MVLARSRLGNGFEALEYFLDKRFLAIADIVNRFCSNQAEDSVMVTLKLPLTDEEFRQIAAANEDWCFESTKDGELVIMPPTGGNTGRRNIKISAQLESWSSGNNLGEAFDSSTLFVLPNSARRSPDAAWIRRVSEAAPLELRWDALTLEQQDKYPPICPDFVIELVSPSDSVKELEQKMQEYLDNGASLGWLIDPKTRQVEVYRSGRNQEIIQSPATLSGEDVLPGFILNLQLIY